MHLHYHGTAIRSTPLERLASDWEGRWRKLSNFLNHARHLLTRATVYEWTDLKLAGDIDCFRKGQDASEMERMLVLLIKPIALNSAHGGITVVDWKPSQETLRIQRRVRDFLYSCNSTLPHLQTPPSNVPIWVSAREEALRQDIQEHFLQYYEILLGLDSEIVGPLPTFQQMQQVACLASCVKLDNSGKLMRFPLIGADVTRHSLHGTYATIFWACSAGHGPVYQQELAGVQRITLVV